LALLLARRLAAAVLLPGRFNPLDPHAEATVREAVTWLQTYSLSGEQVDWPKELSLALATVKGEARQSQVEAALHQLVRASGQSHTFFLDAKTYRQLTTEAPEQSGSLGRVQRLPGGIVAVAMQGYGAMNEAVWQQDANAFRAQILQALQGGACGLRVDLTANDGGNMFPMLSALAPVLPEGPLGYHVDRAGQRVAFERPHIEPGQAVVGLPIAVVTAPRTASSGEFVLTALRAAPQVRSFGEATHGFTTGNVPFALPNGYALVITISELADAKGQRVIGKIAPDQPIPGTDAALEAATQWLTQRCAQGR
jgi:C-terminal processing protease CtpA/Prc